MSNNDENSIIVHNVTFIARLFDTNIYRGKCSDEEFVREQKNN